MKALPSFSLRAGAAIAAGLLALATFSGCAGSPPWGAWSQAPSPERVQAMLRKPETFIYFSRYEVYQRDQSREYVYQDAGAWVHRMQPPVAEPKLLASPHVTPTLNASPETEHALIKRAYPSDRDTVAAPVVAAMP